MQNIVSLQPDRPRPPRVLGVPRSGARILFFTGVRYCRADDEVGGASAPEARDALHEPTSGRMLDAAAH